MRVAVATLVLGDAYAAAVEPGLASKRAYCARHGYALVVGGDEVYDRTRPPAWSKIRLLQRTLPEFDVVFWSDADVVITNATVRLETLLTSGKDVVLSRDQNGLNTGNVFLRRTPAVTDLLRDVYAQTDFVDHVWWEQGAFIHLYETRPDVRAMCEVVDQRAFNAYEHCWRVGSFLIHFAGVHDLAVLRWKMELYRGLGAIVLHSLLNPPARSSRPQ